MSKDLAVWEERLGEEKERLIALYKFSKGAEHSGTMDCKRRIKRYEFIISDLQKMPLFGINHDSEFYKVVESFAWSWNSFLKDNPNMLNDSYVDSWKMAQAALKELTGIKFNFTRTDEYFGVCTDNEEFLIKTYIK